MFSNNAKSTPLPDAWGNLTELISLRIGKNALTRITPNIVNLDKLETLHMPLNQLQGSLLLESVDGTGPALENLSDLDLAHNQLTGNLPSFQRTTKLSELNLSHNRFSGEIPGRIGALEHLLFLNLHVNRLSGRIPSSLGRLPLLIEVRLDQNDLTGTVPQAVCDTFGGSETTLYADCAAGDGNTPPEVFCPAGICCTFCCVDGQGCECVYSNTEFEYLC